MKRSLQLLDSSIPLLLFLSCLLGSCYPVRTPTAVLRDIKTWQRIKIFDGNDYDWLHAAYKVSDGYVIVGVDNHKGLLIKTDDDGITQWVQNYSYTVHDEINCAKEIDGGGYILVGMASGVGGNNGLLVKTNSNGKEDWHQIFEGKCNRLYGIDETESGYILVGSTDLNELGYVIETDINGEKIKDATFGMPESLNTFSSVRQINSLFLVTGCTGAGTWSDRCGWVIELDKDLQQLHQEVYRNADPLFLTDSLSLRNEGYLIVGMINSSGYKACLFKVNKSLEKEWDITLEGGNNELYPSLFVDMLGNYTILSGNGSIGNTWIYRISSVTTGKKQRFK